MGSDLDAAVARLSEREKRMPHDPAGTLNGDIRLVLAELKQRTSDEVRRWALAEHEGRIAALNEAARLNELIAKALPLLVGAARELDGAAVNAGKKIREAINILEAKP